MTAIIENINTRIESLDHKIWANYEFNPESLGLCIGELGLVHYAVQMYEFSGDEKHLEKAMEILSNIFELINKNECYLLSSPNFADGLAGFAWTLNNLIKKDLIDKELEEYLDHFDAILFKQAKRFLEESFFDYLWGAFGIINYLVERENDSSRDLLEQLITLFEKHAVTDELGTRFYNLSESSYTRGSITSLSHGMSGYLLILMKCYEKGIKKTETKELLSNCVKFILSHSTADNYSGCSYFPQRINENEGDIKRFEHKVEYNNRIAWCNGDLNMLFLLYKSNEILANPDYIKLANEVGASTCERKILDNTGIEDAHFCHGASGVAYFFKRLYELSKEEQYRKAYGYWTERTLNYLEEDPDRYNRIALIDGLPGIVLTLISSIKNDNQWDTLFLLD